ncbi:MAG: electron transfer flavoprotein subunit alpha/FixB family protein [Aigarchaeota archaeon]|nr:electron transfer flavoprotein subunit alpha/FixB family protein [Aigarchaeota archaeon]MCX8193181.1 electron transfer flavoprotein subunit alpha/FixB family protein [Nitrososphaeria archaeon]MDW7986322.1 electron transfer flavoprotein subunit alpha/FixB family protein [Nitrososphaerota archaeon]
MKIMLYGESIEWIKQARTVADILDGETIGVTPSRELGNEAVKILNKVYVFDSIHYEPNSYYKTIYKIAEEVKPDLSIFPSTIKGRTLAGLYAGSRDEPVITDVVDLRYVGRFLEVKRLVYGGACVAVLRASTPLTICISQGAFKPSEKGENGKIEYFSRVDEERVQTIFKPREYLGIPLERAEVVVVAGRGFKKREDLEMVKELSSRLDGAWSVTRPLAADYGWADTWIGISGAIVSPRLYIAIGVSGQPLHMIAARNSKTIIAVNKDPSAPIFEEVDYGIIGDLYQVIPRLLEKIKKKT